MSAKTVPECIDPTEFNKETKLEASNIDIPRHELDYPEGGYGWVIVVAGFIIYSVVPGILMSIGVFIKHYEIQMKGKADSVTLSFVGSVANSVFSVLAVAAGRMIDRFGHQASLILGGVLYSGGLFLASFAEEAWHLFLTLGVLSGVGDSLITIGVISAPAQYFNKKLGIASGLIMAGYGAGGFCFSPAIDYMIVRWDVKKTLQILAAVSFTTIFVLSFCYRRAPPSKKEARGFSILKKTRFQILFAGAFISSIGYLVPFIIMPIFAASKGIDSTKGSFLLGLLNGSTSIGRIIMGPCSDYFGRLNMILICSLFASLSCLFWAFGSEYYHFLLFVVSYGITGGSFLSILSVAARQLFPNESVPGITGLIYFAVGLPYLSGPPLAASLSKLFSTGPVVNYTPAIIFTAVFPFLAFIPLVYLRADLSKSWKSKI